MKCMKFIELVCHVPSCFTCVRHCDPQTIACQSPLSMGFSRWKYWNGLPFLTLEDPPNPEAEPTFLASPALAGGSFTTSTTGKDSLGINFIAERLYPLNNTFPHPGNQCFYSPFLWVLFSKYILHIQVLHAVYVFCVWPISLNIMSSRFIHVIIHARISLLFNSE